MAGAGARAPRSAPTPRRAGPRGAASRLSASGWPRGQRQVHRVLEQLDAAQAGAEPLADAAELEQQREVELAGAQARHDLLRLALGERQLDLGVRRRGRWRSPAASASRPAVGNEAIRSRPPRTPAIAASSASAASSRARIAVGVRDQRGAGGGRAHAAPVALDQRRAGLGLERGDRLRDRRLRVGERLGGAPRTSRVAATSRGRSAADVQHQHSLSIASAKSCGDGR